MILDFFLNLAYFVANFLVSLFPISSGFPSSVSTAVTQLGGYTAIINTLIPLSTLSQILLLIIAVELVIFAFKGLRFILGYVPIVGGKG